MKVLLGMREEKPRHTPPVRTMVVATETVRFGPLRSRITAFGRAASAQPVTLASEVGGLLLAGDQPFRNGLEFKQGDVLLRVDDRQIKLEISSQKSELLKALALLLPEIQLDFPAEFAGWQACFDGISFDSTLAPLPEADNGKIRLYLARFNIYKLYFAIRSLEIKLEKHSVVAPFDGVVTGVNLPAGSTTGIGGRLGTIINLEEMEVMLSVSTTDLPWLDREGEVMLYSSESGRTWRGRIVRVSRAIDLQTQTVPVFIALPSADLATLHDGSFLEAELPGRELGWGMRIPREAIYDDNLVYTITDGHLVPHLVEILRLEDMTALIGGDLTDGLELVVENMQGVIPGMPANSRRAMQARHSGGQAPPNGEQHPPQAGHKPTGDVR
ncbi:MAG: HlyD family efflux transporter periplasmic adaptor subunit [bacterium]|nr:HlyD family efflux transporter periplasmic adaptor subunit [bacterium]